MVRTMQSADEKKMTSRRKGAFVTRNGDTTATDPATTEVMKLAAPISSPIANDPDPCVIALKVLNKSGDPFPKAKKVTPALDCLINNISSIKLFKY
jgi:hypothetical protein